MNLRTTLLGGLLFLGAASHAQPPACQCNPAFTQVPKAKKNTDSLYFRYAERGCPRLYAHLAHDSIRSTIAAVDDSVHRHFEKYVERQLRGRRDHLGTARKYVRAEAHARFLYWLNRLSRQLQVDLDAFSDSRLPSLEPVFQAYVNSVKMYHNQSRNLVYWAGRIPGNASGTRTVNLTTRQSKAYSWFVPIHEGNIDDYDHAYQFMELCKNNLLKEFSILALSHQADSLQARADSLQNHFDMLTRLLNDYLRRQEAERLETQKRLTSAEAELKNIVVLVQALPTRRTKHGRRAALPNPAAMSSVEQRQKN
ncbi:MAG: hypothetical protein H7Y12_13950 [Sphingobacteriaceae bacterium]|nr:hypothetical protein [Cytophagaceae bacterium]